MSDVRCGGGCGRPSRLGGHGLAELCENCKAVGPSDDDGRDDGHGLRLKRFTKTVPSLYRWAAAVHADDFAPECTRIAPQIRPADVTTVLSAPLSAPMLVISGLAGAGKTTTAVATGRRHVDNGARSVVFVSALELAQEFCSRRLGEPCKLLESTRSAAICILDDLGKELRLGPIAGGAIIDLVSGRHAHELPTIVTTALRLDDIRRGYEDDGLLRRLTEKGRATVLRLGP